MNHEDFRVDLEFYMGTTRWRCTDIGRRVIVAIKLDDASVTRVHSDGTQTNRKMTRQQAQAEGHFSGPPYGVVEHVLDEYDFGGCMPAHEYILGGGN